jgi:hypothetical protein
MWMKLTPVGLKGEHECTMTTFGRNPKLVAVYDRRSLFRARKICCWGSRMMVAVSMWSLFGGGRYLSFIIHISFYRWEIVTLKTGPHLNLTDPN